MGMLNEQSYGDGMMLEYSFSALAAGEGAHTVAHFYQSNPENKQNSCLWLF